VSGLDLSGDQPPAGLAPPLRALWWDGKGDWDRAHAEIADARGAEAAWVHAYLHRKEGDRGNAAYWYARAGKPVGAGDLAAEWDAIVAGLSAQP
jgi:hypothetical protein